MILSALAVAGVFAPNASQREHNGRDCHPSCCEDGRKDDPLFSKDGANALGRRCILMDDSSECL